MSKVYVIHKASRAPNPEHGSYSGPTWGMAEMEEFYTPYYANRKEAEDIAAELSKFNPVGFKVSEVELLD